VSRVARCRMLWPMTTFRSVPDVLRELGVSDAREVRLQFPPAGAEEAAANPTVIAYAISRKSGKGLEVTVSGAAVAELRAAGAQIGGPPEAGVRSPLGE